MQRKLFTNTTAGATGGSTTSAVPGGVPAVPAVPGGVPGGATDAVPGGVPGTGAAKALPPITGTELLGLNLNARAHKLYSQMTAFNSSSHEGPIQSIEDSATE